MKKLLTSESVTEGHPDKLCDTISDRILDEYLKEDPYSRVAVECLASKNMIVVSGEVTSKGKVDIEKEVKNVLKDVNYLGEQDLDINKLEIIVNISKQSPDIAMGVDNKGAGDQGLMFGFATNETEEYLPLGLVLSHNLTRRLTEVRKKNIIKGLGPDGKSEVTIEYEDNKPTKVKNVVISTEHIENKDIDTLREEIKKEVIEKVITKKLMDSDTIIFINPTRKFVIAGPLGDTGLTGRKIIVDTYGGYARHGGGAFSGKDPTKQDRSAAYMARLIAKNVVANKYADVCEIELSYIIGEENPGSIYINTYGTNKISEDEILSKIEKTFPLTPLGIIDYLKLRRPIYSKTTNYGHFGKKDLPWEKIVKL